jgi:hypothetical protein
MKLETLIMLLEAADMIDWASSSDDIENLIVKAIVNEIGDNLTSDNARILHEYIDAQRTISSVIETLRVRGIKI